MSSSRKHSKTLSKAHKHYNHHALQNKDLRIAFFGDSFTAGAGDTITFQGWPGRLCAFSTQHTPNLHTTLYNLGVRRDTSALILKRWENEVQARLRSDQDEYEGLLVFSFGTNDCVVENGARRVELQQTLRNARGMLARAKEMWPTLMVGPPPSTTYGDAGLNGRIMELEERLESVCAEVDVPFLGTTKELMDDEVWCEEARAGDGIHPGPGGYKRIAERVWAWEEWQRAVRA